MAGARGPYALASRGTGAAGGCPKTTEGMGTHCRMRQRARGGLTRPQGIVREGESDPEAEAGQWSSEGQRPPGGALGRTVLQREEICECLAACHRAARAGALARRRGPQCGCTCDQLSEPDTAASGWVGQLGAGTGRGGGLPQPRWAVCATGEFFGPPSAGTIGGPWEEGGPSQTSPRPPPLQTPRPAPPSPLLIHPCPPPPLAGRPVYAQLRPPDAKCRLPWHL